MLLASNASALSARLVYSPATDLEGCPSQLELERAVQQTLGYDPFSASAPVTVVAVVGRKPDALAASVVVFDAENRPRGHRELSAAANECAVLGQALALSIEYRHRPRSRERASGGAGSSDAEACSSDAGSSGASARRRHGTAASLVANPER
ncbi:MAG: hypothetical protein QM756_34590 [Polyangiaceae bacterium]